jgi:hypothetical protein
MRGKETKEKIRKERKKEVRRRKVIKVKVKFFSRTGYKGPEGE